MKEHMIIIALFYEVSLPQDLDATSVERESHG